jgi:uncharacterized protein (UPF0297 family)
VIAHFDGGGGVDCLNFNYGGKKMTYISGIVSEIFAKLKEKKTILINEMLGSILFFSC